VRDTQQDSQAALLFFVFLKAPVRLQIATTF
jgi:hypothetical protein